MRVGYPFLSANLLLSRPPPHLEKEKNVARRRVGGAEAGA